MTIIHLARSSDQEGNIQKAYECYLESINNDSATLEDYINASFLAFIFQDFGVSQAKHIPHSVIDKSYSEMYKLLDMCESKFGEQKEVEFWRKYYKLILEGKSEHNSSCQAYISALVKISNPKTEKERYLNAICK